MHFCRFKWAHLRQRIEYEKEIHRRKMKNETRKITEEADQYIAAAEMAERLEKKGKLGNLGGGDMATRGVKQRLTEAQILEKQKEKKMKDQKFKAKLQKSKARKQQKKLEQKQKKEQNPSLAVFG